MEKMLEYLMGTVGSFMVSTFKVAEKFKKSKQTKQQQKNATITALQENIMVAIHKTKAR